ncbi:hypothetical protein H6F98_21865 [Microcoleus sp. FACHB-SPT15]|uniref:hypothetical protein n=1 Tax=Microcoleus sp. FACHB-SPT15 TaxID=2692830 RepID=UPI0017849BC3|nr:hypothetical protein [Microcoleus sp. FACHB-SPT15]MBD1808079.1 hypothetical protein [Microcoleus sp. FACHB-SPT15]
MPPAHPGRYQSRLFNFLNRQSIKFTAQCDRAVRQLKVTAVWGAQIVLYPLYLAVQSGLSAGRQLSSAAQAGFPQIKALTQSQPKQETPPAADTPIQRVLCEVNTLFESEPDELLASSPSFLSVTSTQELAKTDKQPTTENEQLTAAIAAQPLSGECGMIQGVATQLETRTLVLVTVQNQIFDILTPQQQQKLASRISWEVADLLRQWRLAIASKSHTPQRLANLDQPRVFLPVRLFWNLMAWVQSSPVAIAANVFQEATLVYHPASQPSQPQHRRHKQLAASNSAVITPHPALAFLDRTVAELESHQLVPGSEVVVTLGDRATSVLRERSQKLRQQLQTPFITPRDAESLEASQPNNSRIQALIYAAVDYFFGRRGSTLPQTDSRVQAEAHQLSGHDSISYVPLVTGSNPEAQTQLPEARNRQTSVTPEKSVWGVLKRYLNGKPLSGKLSAPTVPSSNQIVISETPSSSAINSLNPNTSLTTEASQTNTFRVQALIYAAVDYFFGRHRSHLPGTASQAQPKSLANAQGETPQLSGRNSTSLPPVAAPPNIELAGVSEPDPWLTWDDLYDDSQFPDLTQTSTPATRSSGKRRSDSQAQLPRANSQTPVMPKNSVFGAIKRYLSPKQRPGKLSAPTTREQSEHLPSIVQTAKVKASAKGTLLQSQERHRDTTQKKAKSSSLSAAHSRRPNDLQTTAEPTAITTSSAPTPESHLDPAPDWIEAKSRPVGYVKHPLEQLLGWLDVAILRIEDFMVKVWGWVKRLLP